MTAEWFEARRHQLTSLQSQAQDSANRVYTCPLTNKRFQSEGTYESHTRTKKYQERLKAAGLKEPPPPKVVTKPPPTAAARPSGSGTADGAVLQQNGATAQQAGSAKVRLDAQAMETGKDAVAASSADEDWETDSEDMDEVRVLLWGIRNLHNQAHALDGCLLPPLPPFMLLMPFECR